MNLYKRKIKNSKEIGTEYIREILDRSFIYSGKFSIFNSTNNLVVYLNDITEFIIDGNELNKVNGIIKNINFIFNRNNKKVDRIDTNITINIVGSLEGFTFYVEQSSSIKVKDNQKQFIFRSYIGNSENDNNEIINFKNCKFFGNIGFAFTDNEIGLDNDYINLNSIIFPFTFDKGEVKTAVAEYLENIVNENISEEIQNYNLRAEVILYFNVVIMNEEIKEDLLKISNGAKLEDTWIAKKIQEETEKDKDFLAKMVN